MRAESIRSWMNYLRGQDFAKKLNDSRIQRFALGIAAVVFFSGLMVSLQANPIALNRINLWPLIALLLAGVPCTIMLNAAEVFLTARMVGAGMSLRNCARIAIISGAANMLPIPGGVLIRMAAMKSAGAGYKSGGIATLAVAIIWTGVAFSYAGAWLTIHSMTIGLAFVLTGCIALAFGVRLALMCSKEKAAVGHVTLVKLLLTIVDGTRLWLCLSVIGEYGSFAMASSLTVAAVTGSAISVVPAGLGIREAVSAAIAPLVGLSLSVGFLVPAINRLAGLAILVPISLVLAANPDATHESDTKK